MMLLRDFAYAARTLWRSRSFTVAAVITIALGVGASTAIFSVTSAVLLRPLPYKDPDRLVVACADLRTRSVKDFPFPNADFCDLRSGAKTMFEDFAAIRTGRPIFPRDDGTPEQLRAAFVTTNTFRLLGVKIAFGRDFEEADGTPQPEPPQPQADASAGAPVPPRLPTIVILSYEYWQRRFGGSTAILGRGMTSGGTAGPQIVGVLAPGAQLLFPPNLNVERWPDIWFAARLPYDNANRNQVSHRVIGRLRAGARPEQAQAEVDAVAAELRKNFRVKATAGLHIRLEHMQKYLAAEVRPAILALMCAVIFLLLIACANVANLMLVRASLRERELAVRAALGGNQWRLTRQVLAEALLLSGIGTLFGLGLAWAGIRELLAIAPANLPRVSSIVIDPVVVGFAALAGLAMAAIFGLVPALRASQPDIMHVLRASGRTSGLRGGRHLRNTVVIVEVALSFVLLIGSGLMLRSFLALQRIDPGFNPRGVVTFLLLGGRGGQTPQERAARVREIQSRLRALPGVESVTAANPFPLAGGFSPIRWGTESALADPTKFQAVDFQTVLPSYFETLRTALIEGRTFNEDDNGPGRSVVVIDPYLAAKAFPGESQIGKRILIRIRTPEPEWVEVIGVVAHQRNTSLAEAGREQIYFADGFLGHGAAARWAIRTRSDPASFAASIRSEIARLDPQILITQIQPMDALVEQAQAGPRFSLLLLAIFAVIAALLASVGLYGVLSTVVRQRTSEIGVRMAIGAAPGSIFTLVVGSGLRLSIAGIAIGVVAAFFLTRLMTTMLVGVEATDPATFATMIAVFRLITAAASWLPGRRAAALDPTVALRQE
jgi:putative ABC transport system permease protein